MCDNYKIKNPRQKLRRLLHTELGEITHKYYGFEEKYIGTEPDKAPDCDEKMPPTYLNYYVHTKSNEKLIKSIYYEDSEITGDKIEKLYRLSLKFAIYYQSFPLLTIITKQPLKDCIQKYSISHDVTLHPEIISLAEYNCEKNILNFEQKIINNQKISKIEALNIIFIMKFIEKNHIPTLTHLCNLLNQMNIDKDYKYLLKRAMHFIIHIYVNDIKKINELENILFYDES